jgi:DNA-binding response OmpR family regulator
MHESVLIVDDDRDVADSLAALVRVVLDYDVCVRYSGEDAIATAGEYRPDAVILASTACRPHES